MGSVCEMCMVCVGYVYGVMYLWGMRVMCMGYVCVGHVCADVHVVCMRYVYECWDCV